MLRRLPLAILLVGANSAWAQQVISAHSGVIHFVEGQVSLDGKTIQPKFAEFPDVKNGQTLAAEDGRAEVLLTPGVILRIGENSSFKMISNSRSDTRLGILSGAAIVEVGELLTDNAITLSYGSTNMELLKKGIYRVDVGDGPGKFRVYDGEARVTGGTQTLTARKGREVLLGAVLDMSGFDTKDADALMRWASRRSEYLAQANVSTARQASTSGYASGYSPISYGGGMGLGGNGYGGGCGSGLMGMGAGAGMGGWAYNPWYGMFTYLPCGNGMYYSPFGYPYYSPYNVGYVSVPTNRGGFTSGFPAGNTTTSPHYNAGGFTPRPSSSPGFGSSSSSSSGSSTLAPVSSGGSGGLSSGGSSSGSSSSHSGGGAPTGGRGK
jgi:hypothetical protein